MNTTVARKSGLLYSLNLGFTWLMKKLLMATMATMAFQQIPQLQAAESSGQH